MTTVRTARQKGSSFESDVAESLKQIFPEIKRLYGTGTVLQYDLEADTFVVECKRHKNLKWHEAIMYFVKLQMLKPEDKTCFLIYQNNRQPAMVMFEHQMENREPAIAVTEFEDYFGVPFKKHTPIRRVRK